MKIIRKKLAINNLPAIDYYDDSGLWIASIYERYPGDWSARLPRVELLSCYKTEEDAVDALCFWLPNEFYKNDLCSIMNEARKAFEAIEKGNVSDNNEDAAYTLLAATDRRGNPRFRRLNIFLTEQDRINSRRK